MDTKKLINALRKARKYIRTVETWKAAGHPISDLQKELANILRDFTEGDEIKSIEDALLELGVIL